MSIGKGLAIAGIWLGVGLSAFGAHEATMVIAMAAMFATLFVAQD